MPDFLLKRRWPDLEKGPWLLTGTYVADELGWRCVGLHVQAIDKRDPAQAVTGDLLRRLKPRELGNELRSKQRTTLEYIASHSVSAPPGFLDEVRLIATSLAVEPKGGRPREVGEDLLRAVAEFYVEARKTTDKPTQAVASHWHKSFSTAARWIGAARKAGILEPTTQGKAGGALRPSKSRKGKKR